MGQSKQIAIQWRQEEEEAPVIPNWSELCPDLLRCVFKRLSFISLSRAKSVCSLWHLASRGCLPTQNQIPWLILFPRKEETNTKLLLFVPENKEKVYKTRDLGVDFVQSRCLATYGSWLLMTNRFCDNIYILNLATSEKVDLPNPKSLIDMTSLYSMEACFWIDNRTIDYLVVWKSSGRTVFTKKGVNKWHELPLIRHREFVYNHKNQKLYAYYPNNPIKIWDFSGDIPREEGSLDCFRYNNYDFPYSKNLLHLSTCIAVRLSGGVLIVTCYKIQCDSETWRFRIYKANPHVKRKWVRINSLGDEALILDMGITVVANDVPGIKRNSIYFSGTRRCRDDPEDICVYDLKTQKMERLPQCVFSSIQFSNAQWFFPQF